MEAAVWRDAQSTTGSKILWTCQFRNTLIHGKTHPKIQGDLRRRGRKLHNKKLKNCLKISLQHFKKEGTDGNYRCNLLHITIYG
jgi:hypothetical protein